MISSEAALNFPSAYFLVSHGSRDPRPQLAMNELAQQVAQGLVAQQATATRSGELPLVQTGVLELGLPLHQQLQQFAEQALQSGCESVKLLPMFLLAGVHVMDDIPAEVTQVESHISIQVCPHLGSTAELWKLLQTEAAPESGRILISHGSRRSGVQQNVDEIAAKLGAIAAYWSVSPDIETQVTKLVQQGAQRIELLPYFLFAGGITDAIAQKVTELQQQFPDVPLTLHQPMGATPQMAALIVNLLAE